MTIKKEVPDGGWGWMIVLGAAITNMVNQSLFSQFGLIYGEKLNDMEEGIVGAALAVNISSMITSFTGLITGPILSKFTVRQASLLGVVLTAVGVILSSFATTLVHIILSFSVLTGIGLGLIMPASFMAVNSYFTKRKSQAVGMSVAGTGVGQMLMPQIVHLLLNQYGYQGTTLILGALCLNGIPAALLFEPVENHMKVLDEEKQQLTEHDALQNYVKEKQEIEKIKEQKPNVTQNLVKWLQLDLLKDITFVHIIISLGVAFTCNVAFNMILPFFLQDGLQISRANTATVMSIISAADLLSRFTLPTIVKPLKITFRATFLISAVALGIFRCLLAHQLDVRIMFVIAIFCGYARAGIVINQNLAISEYCTDNDKLAGALGLNMVAKGFAVLSLGQFFGWVRDYTGSFIMCINIQSITLGLLALTGGFEILYKRIRTTRCTDCL